MTPSRAHVPSPLRAAFALALCGLAAPAHAQTYNTYDYWLMPHGLTADLTTVWWNRAGCPSGTAVGQHSFWRGSLWGRTVALQGDPSVLTYDLLVDNGSQLEYWGTFRGNNYSGPASGDSHSFSSPFIWMDKFMSVGSSKQQSVPIKLMGAQSRKVTSSGNQTMRLEINAHFDTWQDPNTGLTWSDVLQMTFWSNYSASNPNQSKELYYLAKGLGTIHFETLNQDEPSCVHYQYATSFQNITPQSPNLPWFDPFKNTAFVPNSFMEDFVRTPVNGGAIGTYLRSWAGTSPDVVVTTDGTNPGTGPWKIALRGSNGGGDGAADAAYPSAWIPVTSGKTYRVSGWVWRVSAADNAYLDFNDGVGMGGNFTDAQAVAGSTNTWEYVEAQTNVGGATQVLVRAVRDGANQGNAYFDGIQIQRVD